MDFCQIYLAAVAAIARGLDPGQIARMAALLRAVRDRGGRLFVLGSGGGAGHASHAACDFRKLAGIEAWCPTDNVSELTARINDEGWDGSLAAMLAASRLAARDAVLVFSVGGGDEVRRISVNLVRAVRFAKDCGATVLGVVGRDGGATAGMADACIVIPPIEPTLVTPLTEAFQAVVWHLLVSHPLLQVAPAKWEGEAGEAGGVGEVTRGGRPPSP